MRSRTLLSVVAGIFSVVLFLSACGPRDSEPLSVPARLWYGTGFVEKGAYPSTPPIEGRWYGSFGPGGDRTTGEWRSPIFMAPARIGFRLAGFPSSTGNSVALVRLSDGARLEARPPDPRESWVDVWLDVPGAWRGSAVQVIATDGRAEAFGWLAFQVMEPRSGASAPGAAVAALLLLLLCSGFVLRERKRFVALWCASKQQVAEWADIFAQSSSIRRWWWLVVLLALVMRKPQAAFSPFLWAEDGTFFLQEHVDRGIGALVSPYAGYLHTYIRIWVLPVKLLPFLWIPRYFMLAGVVPVVVATVYLCSDRFSWPKSGLMALAIPLAPAGGECLLNLVNSQWFIAFWPVLVLLARSAQTRREHLTDIVMLVVSGLTGPFCILLLPLYWTKWLLTPEPRLRYAVAILTKTAVLQFIILQVFGDPPAMNLRECWDASSEIIATIGKRAIVSPILGHGFAIRASNELAIVLTFSIVAGFAISAVRGKSSLFGFALLGVLLLVVPGIVRNGMASFQQDPNGYFADRYFNLPRCLLMWSAIDLVWSARTVIERRVLGMVLAGIVISCLVNFGIDSTTVHDPWEAARSCALGKQRCMIEVSPRGWYYITRVGWHIY